MNEKLQKANRVVIKIGSALITNINHGTINSDWLQTVAADISDMCNAGKEVVIVSSGAIALGRNTISQQSKLEEKQAAAACGQIELVSEYQKCFAEYNKSVAQLLLSLEDSENRRRYLNARNTIDTLLAHGVIPIINENDTVATEEIRFGDNDRLAARVAQMISADMLILLSDIDGFYTVDPNKDSKAQHIPEITEITEDIERMAGGSSSCVGSGGMITKLASATIAMQSGCHMVITKGENLNPIKALNNNNKATWFIAQETPQSARKHWISAMMHPEGVLVIDDGAENALSKGNSLLPVGVVSVKGEFSRGDLVTIENNAGLLIGRGLSAYNALDANKILGRQSHEIEEIVGYAGRDVLVHRDDLILQN